MKKRNNKFGFTLVELLAVIVILAIILVIAVPQIMNVIKDTTKASFESSAKMVAAQVENQYTVAQTLSKEFGDTGSCMQAWAGLNETDYESCTYKIDDDGNAKVTLTGKGKFKDLSVCNGTRSSAAAIEGECSVDTLVTHIQGLYESETTRTSNGLTKDNTRDENIRYAGANNAVKNYVEFGNTNELWRIIGVFNVKTSSDNNEQLIKIVRDEIFKDNEGNALVMSWNSSASTINDGWGVNEWSQADLKNMLNTYYIGESNTCTYCNSMNQATCSNSCNSSVTPINSTYKNMIENVVWNTGAIDITDSTILNEETIVINPVNWYNAERGSVTGKANCDSSSSKCNDTVERTTDWTGLVALPYVTDWGYASSEVVCRTNLWDEVVFPDFVSGTCKKNNWMYFGTTGRYDEWMWMLSPVAHPDVADAVSLICGALTNYTDSNLSLPIRPSVYLKSDVQVIDGDGSSGNPYKLK